MSSSDLFPLKDDEHQAEFEVSSKPTLEFPAGYEEVSTEDRPKLRDGHHRELDKSELTASCGESKVAEDDADGFKTPTSSAHKIAATVQCPPAPKKARPQPSRKRKSSSPRRRSPPLDLSKEVESMFPPLLPEDSSRKIKKARRDDPSD
ncbi:cyclin-dependent protein kinase inhibitor SMR3-like [Diospyros lotus]|uniref:cyclin-dependent protein kinase inhibitor SMR3-like n=1 Tax=Diospyros lotus TaxID=55363 RepID=UPI002250E4AB|nr:cyclin-dependent protein kinase inhibitor SMR3-like [Diospyros lotus]